MNREDITRMAREAELYEKYQVFYATIPELERFAALVSDAAKLEMLMAGHDEWLEEARKAEREACAKVCEAIASSGENTDNWTITRDKAFHDCAAAIRARGNT